MGGFPASGNVPLSWGKKGRKGRVLFATKDGKKNVCLFIRGNGRGKGRDRSLTREGTAAGGKKSA